MKKRIIVLVLGIAFVAAMLASCAPAAQETASSTDYAAQAPMEAPAAPMERDASYSEEEVLAGEAASGGNIGDLPNVNIPETARKLVYSSSFDIESKQFDSDYTKIKDTLVDMNGYVENESTYATDNDYGSYRTSSLTLRVPMEDYNRFLDAVSGIGDVRDKQITTEDISDQYFDTEARIEILEQRRDRLMGYLETATKTEDIIQIESELSDVLYELDQYKGSKRGMDDLVDFARVTVNLREVITAETITSSGDPVGARAANAYQMSLTGVGRFLQESVIGLAAAAPVLILLGVIAAIVFAIIKLVKVLQRKWRNKFEKPADKAAYPQQNQDVSHASHKK